MSVILRLHILKSLTAVSTAAFLSRTESRETDVRTPSQQASQAKRRQGQAQGLTPLQKYSIPPHTHQLPKTVPKPNGTTVWNALKKRPAVFLVTYRMGRPREQLRAVKKTFKTTVPEISIILQSAGVAESPSPVLRRRHDH